MLRSLVVVEGTSDVAALCRAVDCPVAVTNGTPPKAGSREVYRLPPNALLRDLARERDVIIFADPDSAGATGDGFARIACASRCGVLTGRASLSPGRAMRSAVAAVAQTRARVRHAFIGQHLCRCASGARLGDTGVQFANAAAICSALAAAREQDPARAEFTRADLEAWGLAGRLGEPPPAGFEASGGVSARRNAVAAALGIGPCDGKTFLKYANEFGFTRQEVTAAVEALDGGRDAVPSFG